MGNTYIDNLAHKILHTFEKMDAINPTFDDVRREQVGEIEKGKPTSRCETIEGGSILEAKWRWSNEDKIHVFFNFNHLFGVRPFV